MDGVASLVFIGCCLFVPMILAHLDRPVKTVEVVRYREIPVKQTASPVVYKNVETENLKQFSKISSKPIKPAKEATPPIFNDCVDVLLSLGMKKSLAKEKTSNMFKNKNYDSVESFIMDAYKI